ncbi:Piwi domain-containing protein [Zopfochytrium polystomum]|nr:Piwi domain-containing protein [Zopfochytrium polystomum]
MDRLRPRRPGVGTKGTKIKLYSNFYTISIPSADCYHYDVEIKPEVPPPVGRLVIAEWRKIQAAKIKSKVIDLTVFDGRKNIFSPKLIKFEGNSDASTLKISIPEEDSSKKAYVCLRCFSRDFTVTVKLVATVNMERLHRFLDDKGESDVPRDTLQVLDVLLKSRPADLFESVTRRTGGSFYQNYDPRFNISSGLNARNGWRQSLRPTYHDILLNLDIANTCFYQHGPLLHVVASFFNKSRIEDVPPRCFDSKTIEFQRLSKFLATVNVNVTYRTSGRRKYKIRRLHKEGAAKTTMKLEGENAGAMAGKTITIQQYFKQTYNINLRFPNFPCLQVGTSGQVIVPMELCEILPNQRHLGKLNEAQTSDVIKIAAIPPPDRKRRIDEGRTSLHGTQQNPLYEGWGVNISPTMKEVEARILPTPPLLGSAEIKPQNGAFDFSKIPTKFFRPATLGCWGVAVFGDPNRIPFDAVVDFMSKLFEGCTSKGMKIIPRDWRQVIIPQRNLSVEDTLKQANSAAVSAAENRVPAAQMIFCIFERGGVRPVYEEIKYAAETKLSLMTQCFLSKHLFNTKPGVTVNLALKINAKLGGLNAVVEPSKHLNVLGRPIPTMIMGADVTHPPPGADGGVSIAAVVGSMDAKFAEYRAAIRVQPPRLEIIGGLNDVAMELLQQFQQRAKGRLPERVIFYRDGVSEGQFGEVALREVSALKQALREIGAATCKVTFLVVTKRHPARFFVKDPRDGDRKGNVMAGTVVDTGVVHPFEFDFYLNSHAGLQGTSRAAHYHVLYDENGFNADDLQEVTYRMCYLYARATRAVSIVPPAYYSHLVAARARCYRQGGISGGSSEISGGSGGIDSASMDQFSPVMESIRETMYFT